MATAERDFFTRDTTLRKLARFEQLGQDALADPANESKRSKFCLISDDLRQMFRDFEEAQLNIECHLKSTKKEDELEKQNDVRNNFEDLFYSVKSMVLSLSPKNNNAPTGTVPVVPNRLPQIALPTFNGDITAWDSFADLFGSMVDSNPSLSQIEKLHYLRGSLDGEPLQLIRNLPVVAVNYAVAMDVLSKRYANQRLVVTHHIEQILDLPSIATPSISILRKFTASIRENLAALNVQNRPVDNWGDILIIIILRKLDRQTRFQWEQTLEGTDMPPLENLLGFLERLLTTLETIGPSKTASNAKGQQITKAFVTKTSTVCVECKGDHSIIKCSVFQQKNAQERFELAKTANLCFNCLATFHNSRSCPSRNTCRTCGRKHHTLLHFPRNTPTVEDHETAEAVTLATKSVNKSSTVLLGTAMVEVVGGGAIRCQVRMLLDSASQASYITENCAQRLGLPRRACNTSIAALGDQQIMAARGVTTCTLRADNDNKEFTVNTLIVRQITSNMPTHSLPAAATWNHLRGLRLADPAFNQPGPIDILLGADVFPSVLLGGRIVGSPGTPSALETVFGWVLLGSVETHQLVPIRTLHTMTHPTLEETLRKFWEVEEVPRKTSTSPDDDQCEQNYIEGQSRDASGRYIVALPFREPRPTFMNTDISAMACYRSLRKRLNANTSLKQDYIAFMEEYLTSGHMELIEEDTRSQGYYIPHHCILKPESSTTKLRVVFNASRRDALGVSLNDALLPGPALQQDIRTIVLRFRFHRIVMTADVKQMYRQIVVRPEDRLYQQILWDPMLSDQPQTYQLKTVTYGVNCAPFLALRTLQQLANDERDQFPVASEILKTDVYVDDIITGSNSITNALHTQQQLIQLLKAGGFELRKWCSNEPSLLSWLPSDQVEQTPTEFNVNGDHKIKVLGLWWDPATDLFLYQHRPIASGYTKRRILSEIAHIYDPLGWLTPVVLLVKRILQAMWTHGLDWDEEPPQYIKDKWTEFTADIENISQIRIPRWVPAEDVDIDLIGFCDASEAGYAAVIYLRTSSSATGMVKTYLLTAKSRVAPIKRVSLPRLELCAAVLLARLMHITLLDLPFEVTQTSAWTDSKVVLSWIRSSPHRWKTFVSNRVTEIQAAVSPSRWHHVMSAENPADCASRGVLPSNLCNNALWWCGPRWLRDPHDTWPKESGIESATFDNELTAEARIVTLVLVDDNFWEQLINRHSSYNTLIRVIAYCSRFGHNCRSQQKRRSNRLSSEELNNALNHISKNIQATVFREDLTALERGKPTSKQLRKLTPYVDDDGVLRVGGRLNNASLSHNQKHPIILPGNHPFTTLLIRHYHFLYCHPGAQTLHSILAQRFWILSGRCAIKKVVRTCNKCFRTNPATLHPLMGDLPKARVTGQVKPFLRIGVDYAGPFPITLVKKRGARSYKSYVCLIICFATKAVHLELASDLSSEAFLAAFRRFMGRRGRCTDIYSDCGTNFVGASRKLTELYGFVSSSHHNEHVAKALEPHGVTWHFNPPAAPHFGGIWEAGVKSVKTHLRRVIGEQILTYEELYTALVQIEALLNSRPLCPLSDDPNDLQPLTPGHFLVQEPLVTVPDQVNLTTPMNRLTRWQLLQRMVHCFWKRWHSEYLHQLQQRQKWHRDQQQPVVGSLMLIKEESTPPIQWRLGRITKLCPGPDGIVRVVHLKTASGEMIRPLAKLCPLPSQ